MVRLAYRSKIPIRNGVGRAYAFDDISAPTVDVRICDEYWIWTVAVTNWREEALNATVNVFLLKLLYPTPLDDVIGGACLDKHTVAQPKPSVLDVLIGPIGVVAYPDCTTVPNRVGWLLGRPKFVVCAYVATIVWSVRVVIKRLMV
jgi:hypothetical protein